MATVSNQLDEDEDVSAQQNEGIVIEGWLYKKANIAIQGYKRRWARINTRGEFIYSKHPGRFVPAPCS